MNKIEEPENYLGAKIKKRVLDGKNVWSISSDDYVKAALKNVNESIKDTRWHIPKDVDTPRSATFRPELDDSPELESHDVTLYLELIGIIRWATEIGRVDVLHEISILSQYQAIPREGHMKQLLRIFSYM